MFGTLWSLRRLISLSALFLVLMRTRGMRASVILAHVAVVAAFSALLTLGITAERLAHPDFPQLIGSRENGHWKDVRTHHLIHGILTALHRPSSVFCHCHWRDNLLLTLMSKAHHYSAATWACLTWRWMHPRLERHLGDF